MQIERFKIKNANSEEIEIEVLTEDNVANPYVHYSFPFESIKRNQQNYRDLQELLADLIQRGKLRYIGKDNNEHVFESYINSLSSSFERINIKPDHYGKGRTLENMLYAVCQANNIPMPDIIRPKGMLTTMYNQLMYPATPDDEINSAIITGSLVLGAAATYCAIKFANRLRS